VKKEGSTSFFDQKKSKDLALIALIVGFANIA
jgi:hypothetical protein